MLSRTRQARAEAYRSETLARIAEMAEEARRRRSSDSRKGPSSDH